MEPVLFYGNHAASSFGSIVALEWLGQPYRLSRLNLPFDAKSDSFTRINPVQKVPTLLRESGVPLSESSAILQHLAGRDPRRTLVYAPGSPEQDHLNQVLAFLHTDFWASFFPGFEAYDMELTGEKNPAMQEMLRHSGRKRVAKAHADLERMMGNNEWLAGDKRTIADAYFIGVARWAPFLAATGAKMIDPRDYPRLLRHYEKLEADPAVIFAHAIEDEKPATSAGGFLGHLSLEEVQTRIAR
ncbi:Glutathione S-transferase [Labilithrix luteola]|uniref:Glutathione S-transferase n=2 Tax=Labilithrix luteola TaxID=1391654 RepID=A0A0K1PNP1_9BACT|nr:Glutathione S-transferase [Labilithrix luteola]